MCPVETAFVILADGPVGRKPPEQRCKNGRVFHGKSGALSQIWRHGMRGVAKQNRSSARERGHWIEIENVRPDQRVRRGPIKDLRNWLVKSGKHRLHFCKIGLSQLGVVPVIGTTASKPVDPFAGDRGQSDAFSGSPAFGKTRGVHSLRETGRDGSPASVASEMLTRLRKQRSTNRGVNAIASEHQLAFHNLPIRKAQGDVVANLPSIHAFHFGADDKTW